MLIILVSNIPVRMGQICVAVAMNIDICMLSIADGNTKIIHIAPTEEKKCYSLSCVQLFATPLPVACQVSLSMEFSR